MIDIDVYILVPAEPRPCTMIYKTYPIRIGSVTRWWQA